MLPKTDNPSCGDLVGEALFCCPFGCLINFCELLACNFETGCCTGKEVKELDRQTDQKYQCCPCFAMAIACCACFCIFAQLCVDDYDWSYDYEYAGGETECWCTCKGKTYFQNTGN
mgnify:CR=1 FL=1